MPNDFALNDATDDARGGGGGSGGGGGGDIAALFAQFEARTAAREAELRAEIFEAINANGRRGAARASAAFASAEGGGGGGDEGIHGRLGPADQADFPVDIREEIDDAASSYLSGNSTAPGDSSTESEKLRRIVGEEDKTVAYDPNKRHLSVAWNKACTGKGGKHGLSANDIPQVSALCASARALLDAEALLACADPESVEQQQDHAAVMGRIQMAIQHIHVHLNSLALRETFDEKDSKAVDRAARAKAEGVYLGDGAIPITHTAFNDILLEVQHQRAKNTLKKLHGAEDTKKSKADDDDDEAGPKKKRADEQDRARQRKYNEALSALRKHEPEWKPTSTKDGAAKKKKSAGAKPAAAAAGGGE
jgi:hypothetical protein